jgi:hypothetical protein
MVGTISSPSYKFKACSKFIDSKKVSIKTTTLHLTGVISYLSFHDIDIIPVRFKKRVTVPKLRRGREQAIDVKDIRKILLACNNKQDIPSSPC